MADKKETEKTDKKADSVTIKRSTVHYIAIFVIALAIGFTVGTLSATGNVAQQPNVPDNQNGNTNEPIIVSLDDDPVMGNENAPITIIEFSDFECPFCSRFFDQTLPQIKTNYIDTGKVKLVYRDFPLSSIHFSAQKAAEAAECADDQGKWNDYHDTLFAEQASWGNIGEAAATPMFKQFAVDLGLNAEQFNACLDNGTNRQEVQSDFQAGLSAGVSGTPTFFIGNEQDGYTQLVGAQPYTVFQQAIDAELAA